MGCESSGDLGRINEYLCKNGPIRERFENLYDKKKKEIKDIINFKDVKKGDLYVNLIHYDKNMKNNENYEYYRYFSIKIIGDYNPFDDLNMVKLFLSKTKELPQPSSYILMTSGAESINILKEFHEIPFITDFIIFCYETYKYFNLKGKYKKLKLITNQFDKIREFLLSKRFSDRDLNLDNHLPLTPLITYFDYKKSIFPIHRVLSYFFDEKFEFFSYEEFETAKKFISETNYESDIKEKIIKVMGELVCCENFPEKCIKYYTGEDLCYVFNKSLRNFEKFYVEMCFFIGPFYYGIYRYAMEHPKKQLKDKAKILYRDITMNRLDLYAYKFCEYDIICFPSFTSTTFDEKLYFRPSDNSNKINNEKIEEKSYVRMIITYKPKGICQTQGVDISDKSQFGGEKEILLFPFTFAKIDKVEIHSGKENDRHLIYMTIINKGDVLEYGLKKKYAFKLTDYGSKIIIDKQYNSSYDKNELYYGVRFRYINDKFL